MIFTIAHIAINKPTDAGAAAILLLIAALCLAAAAYGLGRYIVAFYRRRAERACLPRSALIEPDVPWPRGRVVDVPIIRDAT